MTAPAIRKRLLAIDGGGVRGVVPASALAALERTAGRPAREIFDFMAGTSTGAVIVAALAAGIPAAWIVMLYSERSGAVLRRWPWSTLARILTARCTTSVSCIGSFARSWARMPATGR